jgi:hypothetical protein
MDEFLHDNCYECGGNLVTFMEFYSRFVSFLSMKYPNKQDKWTKRKVSTNWDDSKFPKGKIGRDIYVANISFNKDEKAKGKFYLENGKLIEEKQNG